MSFGCPGSLGCVGRAGRARLSWWVRFGQENGRQLASEEKGGGYHLSCSLSLPPLCPPTASFPWGLTAELPPPQHLGRLGGPMDTWLQPCGNTQPLSNPGPWLLVHHWLTSLGLVLGLPALGVAG